MLTEFLRGTVDIAKAHALPWDRCKLLLHGVCDLRHQCFMIRHCRVDCCQHCLLERRFVQRWGVHAVFLAIIQSAHTSPHSALFAVLRPHHSAIYCPAFSAEHESAESIFPAEFSKACWRTLFCTSRLRSTSRHFKLHCIKLTSWNDRFVMVSNQTLAELSCIFYSSPADAVINESLLEQGIAAVFFVGQDRIQVRDRPFCFSQTVDKAIRLQCLLNISKRLPRQIHLINAFDSLGLFRLN